MANTATERMSGMFRTVATGVAYGPRLVVREARPTGPVAGVHGSAAAALAQDAAGALVVLGSAAALWIGFLAATW